MKIVTPVLLFSLLLSSYAAATNAIAEATTRSMLFVARMATSNATPISLTAAANVTCQTGVDVSAQVQALINAHLVVNFPTYNGSNNGCQINEGINLTGFLNGGPIIHGNGAQLLLSTGSVPAWDFTGSQFIVMDNLFMTAGGPTPSKYGILMGRPTSCAANFGEHHLTQVGVNMAINGSQENPGSIGIDMEGSEQNTLENMVWVQADTALMISGYPAGAVSWPIVKSVYSSQCTRPQTNIGTVLINGSYVGMISNSIVTNGAIQGFTGIGVYLTHLPQSGPPEPTPYTAVKLGGNISEWNLTARVEAYPAMINLNGFTETNSNFNANTPIISPSAALHR